MSRNFKVARKMNNLKLTEAAKLLGVSQPTLSAWEGERKSPTIDSLLKMSELYGVTTDFLLGRCQYQVPKTENAISHQTLPSMHRSPVWSKEYGWMIVDSIKNRLIIDSDTYIDFETQTELYAFAPSMITSAIPQSKPISKQEIHEYKEVWVEPISSDIDLRNELRGWYRVRERFVENEFGNRFYFDVYGAKWISFKSRCV